mmetsp:Transcript_34088/g.68705  ORF Transcript_34088/g.68705 Transcript_34088/m.68705 type:complete len:407 (-) Transcript_34088:38-1258(-)
MPSASSLLARRLLATALLIVTPVPLVQAFLPPSTHSSVFPQHRSVSMLLSSSSSDSDGTIDSIKSSIKTTKQSFQAAADEGFGTKAKNAAYTCSVGDIIVPLCSNLTQRQELANRGIYAGVEYKVCELSIDGQEQDTKRIQTLDGQPTNAKQTAKALIKPAYPLRDNLERNDWPVSVSLDEVPLWLSRSTYIAGNAVGTLAVSSFFVAVAAILAFFVRIVSVPTPSMLPAFNPGNILLVTRTIPIGPFRPHVGDVLFFNAPPELESTVSNLNLGESGSEVASTKGKQFLKRVVAVPGEKVGVKQSEPYVAVSSKDPSAPQTYRLDIIGPYARPEIFDSSSWDRPPSRLAKNEFFVAGDNGYRSVDSRVWGPLKDKYIVGTARLVIWPLNDFGPIGPGPIKEIIKSY